MVVAAVGAAFSEELLLRGLLLKLAIRVLGAWGILYGGCLSAVLYLGWPSPYVALMFLSSLYFGWFVSRNHAIWGVVAARSAMNVLLIGLWPIAEHVPRISELLSWH